MALNLPRQIQSGDSLKFVDEIANYPASSWTLTYTFTKGDLIINFSGTADGDKHSIALLPSATTKWVPGSYRWQATVSDGTDRFSVGFGRVEILPDFTKSGQGEFRHVEKVLTAIEALLEGKATQDQASYSIAGRSLSKYSIPELLAWRDKYKGELRRLERADQGLGSTVKIKARF